VIARRKIEIQVKDLTWAAGGAARNCGQPGRAHVAAVALAILGQDLPAENSGSRGESQHDFQGASRRGHDHGIENAGSLLAVELGQYVPRIA
jgi:hypothetical protein